MTTFKYFYGYCCHFFLQLSNINIIFSEFDCCCCCFLLFLLFNKHKKCTKKSKSITCGPNILLMMVMRKKNRIQFIQIIRLYRQRRVVLVIFDLIIYFKCEKKHSKKCARNFFFDKFFVFGFQINN